MTGAGLAIEGVSARFKAPPIIQKQTIKNLQENSIVMKIILTLAAIAAASFSSLKAGDYCSSYSSGYSSNHYAPVAYCAPYVVCTHTVHTCQEQRQGHDHCGRCYYYYVTVVTYKDVYNTGEFRTYTRTFRA